MIRSSYLIKVLLLLLGLVAVLEVASYIATRLVIRDAVTDNAREELLRGGEVFEQLMQARAEQLALSVSVLTDDFGFKEAVATGDADTIRSALANHGARVSADIGVVVDNSRQLVASTAGLPPEKFDFLEALEGEGSRAAYASLILDNRPYQFVVSPVRAPLQIATAGLGFEINDQLVEALKRLTGLEIAFVNLRTEQLSYLSGTLTSEQRVDLLERLGADGLAAGRVSESQSMMSLFVPMSEDPKGLVAVLQVPLSEVLAPFARLDTRLIWLALLFSLLAALLALLLARGVTRPVRTLAGVAKRIASGYYDAPVEIRSKDEFGELARGFTKMQSAIAEREQQILYQAQHDSLTQLINRGQLFPELERAIERAKWTGSSFALLVIDVDNFTRINDALSPEIGDQVLREVAQRIAAQAQQDDAAFRLGSDEFALLLVGAESDAALVAADVLLQRFEPAISLEDISLNVDINIGLVVYPSDGEEPEALLRRANLALNQSRVSQQRISPYQAGWDEQHLRRLALFGEFREALQAEQISLNYQPKINLRDRHELSAEALVRWNHPLLGFVNPEEFIAVAESTGQIGLLTRWVLKTGIEELAHLNALGRTLELSINLSALDLLENDLPDYIEGLLEARGVPAGQLCLEITESAIMGEAEKSLRNLDRLRGLGLTLSIDDFGTGYSSLSQLKKLPVSELKIDKSFILNLVENEDDQLIVRSTIELGHTLGLSITAEGVETGATEKLLEQLGCDKVQGWLYSKALPATEFEQWLESYFAELEK